MSLPAACLAHVLAVEGGWQLTDTTGDRGGRTYAGISERANPDWRGWEVIARHGPDPQARDGELRRLVRERYEACYWSPLSLGDLHDSGLARQVFSTAVVSGPETAAQLLQEAVGARVDGLIGPATLARANLLSAANPTAPRLALAGRVVQHFAGICDRDPSQRQFLRGWVNRARRDAGLTEEV